MSATFASAIESDILNNKDSENTKKVNKLAVGIFQVYLQEKGQLANLRDLLKKFYIEARRKDKEEYSKSTLTTLRLVYVAT